MLMSKLISIAFRLLFFVMLVLNYYYFIFSTWLPLAIVHPLSWIIIFVYNFLFIMLIWTLYVTRYADSGEVPLYWGFFLGDSDAKRRRYCLMCNVFKPERCHHCSLCHKCVLNMDHHCPWINTCIGFFNRKYFIQMLFYICSSLYFTLFVNFKFTLNVFIKISRNRININKELTDNLAILLIYFADVAMTIILTMFFKFHLKLVLENKTTIETIDKKTTEFDSIVFIIYLIFKYSKGSSENWKQVMGNSKLLWFFPLRIYIGSPCGNGIDWNEPNFIDEKKITQLPTINNQYQSNQSGNYNSNLSRNKDIPNKDNSQNLANSQTEFMKPSSSLSSLYSQKVIYYFTYI